MDRQILSQEEINALLKDTESMVELTPLQRDALGEIGNISYGTAATALSELLRLKVNIDTPSIYVTTERDLREQHATPYVLVEVDYKEGLQGSNVLILKVEDSSIISDLMMGGDGTKVKTDLDQMELSAVGEAMNQMVGNAATSMSTLFSKRIGIDPPRVRIVDLGKNELNMAGLDEHMVVISFKLEIGDLTNSEVMLLIPFQFATEMADALTGKVQQTSTAKPVKENRPPVEYSVPPMAAAPSAISNFQTDFQPPPLQPQVMIQPAKFAPIGATKTNKESGNIGLLLDVPLQVTVELGSTRMKIKDILELGLGSVIELDKLAGDPVDIFVNGKLIARGEVVVIDENFGIKISDIVSPLERANTLQ